MVLLLCLREILCHFAKHKVFYALLHFLSKRELQCLTGFDRISDSHFFSIFPHICDNNENLSVLNKSRHAQILHSSALSPGISLEGKNWLMVNFTVMCMPPCFRYMVRIVRRHRDVIFLYRAVLEIPNLWAESYLVLFLVNFWSRGNIAMVAFFARVLARSQRLLRAMLAITMPVIRSQGCAVLLQHVWGWSATILVIFYHVMTPILKAWLQLLPWILLGQYCIILQTWWDNENTRGIMNSYFNPRLNLCPWRDSSCHLTEIDEIDFGTP